MKITLTLDYSELQKIITGSPTMRALLHVEECPIVECKKRFLYPMNVDNMIDHQIKYNPGSSKIAAVKYLISQASDVDAPLRSKLMSLGCSFHHETNKLDLRDAKHIVEKYFY